MSRRGPPTGSSSLPGAGLELEFVHGYHGSRCRNNMFYTASGEIVYFIAALGIVYNPKTHTQRFFGTKNAGHTDDIISLAVHPNGRYVATGQMGKDPLTCVWDSETMELVSYCKGFHERGIPSLAFSADGSRLATVGLDDRYSIAIWDWEKGVKLADAKGHTDRIFEIVFDPNDTSRLCTVGVKHIKFWSVAGNTLAAKKGIFGNKGPIQTMMCCAFDGSGNVFAGTLSGDVYVWADNNLVRNYARVHQGPVYTIAVTDTGALTAGKDGVIAVWAPASDGVWQVQRTLDINPDAQTIEATAVVRSISYNAREDTIAVGLRTSEIYEVNGQNGSARLCVAGHAEGELWGLSPHPSEPIIATCSDDGTVRTWDIDERRVLGVGAVPAPARSCAFSPDGRSIAVGMKSGRFAVIDANTMEDVTPRSKQKRRREVLHEIRYSPNGKYLAVCSNDNYIDIYDVEKEYKYVSTCTGHSSYITHIDFSADSKYIQTNDGSYEHLVFEVPKGGRNVTTRGIKESTEWESFTCVIADSVAGIWPKFADKTDINGLARSGDGDVVATAGDDGFVRLFAWPPEVKGAKNKRYRGHSSHVTCARFSHRDEFLLTTGGLDQAIFQWRYNDADPDSDEGSDDDTEDEFDSDINAERGIDYDAAASGSAHASSSSSSVRASASVSAEVMFDAPPSAPAQVAFAGRPRGSYSSRSRSRASASSGMSAAVSFKPSAPDKSLELDWAYGYRIFDTRNNLWYIESHEVVWHTGALGVVYNPETHKMRLFQGAHDDDIISLAVHPNNRYIATGQVGKNPKIVVWDAITMETLAILQGDHSRGVCALSFSSNPDNPADSGEWLVSAGVDDNHTVVVYIWQKGIKVAEATGSKEKIFVVEFNPFSRTEFVTVGVRHINFWSIKGNGVESQRGIFGSNGEIQTLLDISFASNGKAYAGGSSGDILEFEGNRCTRTIRAHSSACYTVHECHEGFVSGGKDGVVMLWTPEFRSIRKIDLSELLQLPAGISPPCIRATTWHEGRVLVGTKDSDIYELDDRGEGFRLLHAGHAPGELWGLAAHPTKHVFATCSDDKTVRMWNADDRTMVGMAELPLEARSCGISPDATHVAVGLKNGSVMILNADSLSEVVVEWRHRKEAIAELVYSPDGAFLAVGSHDNYVDIYDVGRGYRRCGCCSGSSSYITHVDWSTDSRLLQTNSGAYEHLFFEAPKGKRAYVTKQEMEESARGPISNLPWEEWTSVLGDPVTGIWPSDSDGTDVNAAHLNKTHGVLATGDDFGLVKLFNWPVLDEGTKFKKYQGHSAHVTNVRFTVDDHFLLTTGGGDQTVLQWRMCDGRDAGSDDEPEDDDGFDSDVDNEVMETYTPKIELIETKAHVAYAGRPSRSAAAAVEADVVALAETNPSTSRPRTARAGQQEEPLELEWVHGYRGHDTRNNVHYSNSGEIVYHTAGVGIIYNKANKSQRFYTTHRDDIISFANTLDGSLVATGEVGKDPALCVWDASTGETRSIIKGAHERGICAISFTASGKRVVSVGIDDNHTIAFHKWETGIQIATAPGHKDKIFNVVAHPEVETEFTTVGVKHIKFWSLAGNALQARRGVFGSFALQTMMCAEYGDNGTVYTGSMGGDIYVWNDAKCTALIQGHEGAVYDIFRVHDGRFVTGGKDGVLRMWTPAFEPAATVDLGPLTGVEGYTPTIRALCWENGNILVGTRNSEIYEVDERGRGATLITQGHAAGELWGLAMHPSRDEFATASDDHQLRTWSLTTHEALATIELPDEARSVAYAPDDDSVPTQLRNGHIAVGLQNGSFMVFDSNFNVVVQQKHRREVIHELKYSPNGNYLAVGSNDNYVDIYDCTDGYKRCGCCSGASSYITHVDWSTDSTTLVLNSGAYERLMYFAPRGARAYNKDVVDKSWATVTGVLGDDVEGIWPKYSDKTDVNASCRTKAGRHIATADDFGFVKLFSYPVTGSNAPHQKFIGHSSHVTNVRFSRDDSYCVSVGGMDKSVFQWRVDPSLSR